MNKTDQKREQEKALPMPKPGELWKTRPVDYGPFVWESSVEKGLNIELNAFTIVLVCKAKRSFKHNNDLFVQMIAMEKICGRRFRSIATWHKFFERVK